MTLFAITQTIRNAGGQVLLCGSHSFGYIVRASIGVKPLRVISPTSKKSLKVLPLEPGVETHIVSDAQSLHNWLNSLSPKRAIHAA